MRFVFPEGGQRGRRLLIAQSLWHWPSPPQIANLYPRYVYNLTSNYNFFYSPLTSSASQIRAPLNKVRGGTHYTHHGFLATCPRGSSNRWKESHVTEGQINTRSGYTESRNNTVTVALSLFCLPRRSSLKMSSVGLSVLFYSLQNVWSLLTFRCLRFQPNE